MDEIIKHEEKNEVVQVQVQAQKLTVTEDKVELLKRTLGNADMTDDELQLFVTVCNRAKLDPFMRQIYPVSRWNDDLKRPVMTFQIGIDGLRVLSERSGLYRGQVGPFWCGKDGVWQDCWISDTPPVAAKVGILRAGFEQPQWGFARFAAFAQVKRDGSVTRMWRKMPETMLAKCAEAQARRLAFPQDCEGLYLHEEMQQADNPQSPPRQQQQYTQTSTIPAPALPDISATGWENAVVDRYFLRGSLVGQNVTYRQLATDEAKWKSLAGKNFTGRQLVHMWEKGQAPALREIACALLVLYPHLDVEAKPEQPEQPEQPETEQTEAQE